MVRITGKTPSDQPHPISHPKEKDPLHKGAETVSKYMLQSGFTHIKNATQMLPTQTRHWHKK